MVEFRVSTARPHQAMIFDGGPTIPGTLTDGGARERLEPRISRHSNIACPSLQAGIPIGERALPGVRVDGCAGFVSFDRLSACPPILCRNVAAHAARSKQRRARRCEGN